MANSVTSVAVAAFVGAAVAVIAGVVGIEKLALRGVGKKMVHAEIHLDTVGGDCMIQTSPQTLEAFKRETIQWTIIDTCGVTRTSDVNVVFAANDPLDPACTPRGRKKITCTLKNAVDYGTYKYSVQAQGAQPEDPELEIVQ
jgi:hypothetical protein